ncbi:cytochrome P450 71A8-like [Impatiens glandulifera]|uniref:cytochrome P450 71A8-like n=1 Tax=Impatiens glandulifera TaxID=253017 RepID=UPI001FB19B54|nr:cytochrome P450 71A8-like [Impatiens glandulifera]
MLPEAPLQSQRCGGGSIRRVLAAVEKYMRPSAVEQATRISFGRKYDDGENGRRFRHLVKDFLRLLGTMNIEDFLTVARLDIHKVNGTFSDITRVAKEMDEFLDEIIEKKMKENGERNQEAGVFIDRDSVKAIILDIFLGGTNTTSIILEWAMTELLRHPENMKELVTEVRKIANGKTMITEEDIQNMPYFRAFIKETLRYHTPFHSSPYD